MSKIHEKRKHETWHIFQVLNPTWTETRDNMEENSAEALWTYLLLIGFSSFS